MCSISFSDELKHPWKHENLLVAFKEFKLRTPSICVIAIVYHKEIFPAGRRLFKFMILSGIFILRTARAISWSHAASFATDIAGKFGRFCLPKLSH